MLMLLIAGHARCSQTCQMMRFSLARGRAEPVCLLEIAYPGCCSQLCGTHRFCPQIHKEVPFKAPHIFLGASFEGLELPWPDLAFCLHWVYPSDCGLPCWVPLARVPSAPLTPWPLIAQPIQEVHCGQTQPSLPPSHRIPV